MLTEHVLALHSFYWIIYLFVVFSAVKPKKSFVVKTITLYMHVIRVFLKNINAEVQEISEHWVSLKGHYAHFVTLAFLPNHPSNPVNCSLNITLEIFKSKTIMFPKLVRKVAMLICNKNSHGIFRCYAPFKSGKWKPGSVSRSCWNMAHGKDCARKALCTCLTELYQ